jgi:hypothetical protein
VARVAIERGLSTSPPAAAERMELLIRAQMFEPVYQSYV